MKLIHRLGLAGAFLAAFIAVGIAISPAQAQTAEVRLLGQIVCLLSSGEFCIETSVVGHTQTGGSSATALDTLLNALPWTNLAGVDNLDATGAGDIVDGDDLLIADNSDSGALKRVSLGQIAAFFNNSGNVGLTAVSASPPLSGNGTVGSPLVIANSSATSSGVITAAQFQRLQQAVILDTSGFTAGDDGDFPAWDNTGSQWVNAALSGAGGISVTYTAGEWQIDGSGVSGGGGGTITAITAGDGLSGGGNSGNVTLDVENPFTDAEEQKLSGIADNANDYALPRNLDAFANDLSGNGYVIQSNGVANARTAQPEALARAVAFSYITAYSSGPRAENTYYYTRVLTSDIANLALYELRVGDADDDVSDIEMRVKLDGTDLPAGVLVVSLGASGNYTYYRVFLPNTPAADAVIQVRYDRLTVSNVDIPYDLLTDVPAMTGVTFTAADETKLDGIEDNANDYRLPGNIAALADDITGAGYVILPGVVATTHTASQSNVATAAGYAYANFYGTGPRLTSQFWYFRLPVDTALDGIEARVGDSDNTDIEGRIPAEDWTALGNLGNYDYYAVQIDDKPAGDALIVVQLDKPTLANVEVPYNLLTGVPDSGPLVPADGSIDPSQLNFDLGKDTPGNAVTVNAAGDGFSSLQLVGQREIFNGSASGVSLFQSLDTASTVTTTALSDPLDVDDEGHGLVGGSFALTLVSRTANTVRWDAGGTVEDDPVVNVSGFISLETLASSPAYLATSSDLGVPLIQQDVYNGSNVRGVLVIRLAHDAAGRVNFNAQYLPDAGFTDTATADITISGSIVLLATGAPRGESGTGGPIFEFATALPSADDSAVYPDGSLALVYSGAQQGLYRKSSHTTHVKADTGMAGLDVDPTGGSATLQSAGDGRYTTLYVARTGFTGRGGSSLAANNSRWSAMPAALSHLFLSYRTTTRADGEVEFKYSSARTYTGDIRITAGSLTLEVARIDSTTWRLTGLSAAQVAALRENVWRLSEPGQTGTITTHSWDQVIRAMPNIVAVRQATSPSTFTTGRGTGILSVTITPRHNNSQFIVEASGCSVEFTSGSPVGTVSVRLFRGSNDIGGVVFGGARVSATIDTQTALYVRTLDAPQTTAAVTYTVVPNSITGGGQLTCSNGVPLMLTATEIQ